MQPLIMVNYYPLSFKLIITTLVKFDVETDVRKCVSGCRFAHFGEKPLVGTGPPVPARKGL
jgi:hypothetical protein